MASSINASTTAGLVNTADTSGVLQLQTAGTTAISIDASQAVSFTNSANLPNTFGFKNRIINGAMVIDQRNAGATTTPADFAFITDRWQVRQSTASKMSAGQSSVVPAGFSKSLLFTSLSAYSVGASDIYCIRQQIEGFNTADLNWGTSDAQTVTLSFWVRSSLTGTFGGAFINAANNRSYVFTYSISAANTWEYKTITVAGDTTGTWETGNLRGIQITFGLGVGSTSSGAAGSWSGNNYASATGATSVVGTSGATFYITGVQLEKGSTATSFDYRPYTTELQLCQRYFVNMGGATNSDSIIGTGFKNAANQVSLSLQTPVTLRATPSILVVGSIYALGNASNNICTGSASSILLMNPNGFRFLITTTATLTDNVLYGMYTGSSSNYISVSAEL